MPECQGLFGSPHPPPGTQHTLLCLHGWEPPGIATEALRSVLATELLRALGVD